jgi:hypothetical protein
MICAGCSHEVSLRARFCEACGAPLPEASPASAGAPAESASRARMYAALRALIAFLQREGRVSYRALAHVFNGDQAFLDAAREELTFRRSPATKRARGWSGRPSPCPHARSPRTSSASSPPRRPRRVPPLPPRRRPKTSARHGGASMPGLCRAPANSCSPQRRHDLAREQVDRLPRRLGWNARYRQAAD